MVKIAHAARDIARITDISRVLIRYGFGEVVSRLGIRRPRGGSAAPAKAEAAPPPSSPTELASLASPEEVLAGDQARREMSAAVRLRRVLEELGPSFVKLGQIASTRPDVLPADVINEFRKLQDAVPPFPFEQVKDQVERTLGAPLHELFESIDETPLAAGSIAQVHRARLKVDGAVEEVVIKVQRPGIAQTIASDVDLLHSFAALIERAIPESRIYSPVGLVQQFDRAITAELDFAQEADNALRFTKNFEDRPDVRFPRVFRQASGKQVLTLEYLDGKRLYDAIQSGYSGQKMARVALEAVVKQIFEDGFFHADPHPGNIIILGAPEAPVLALIDLGMVGRLSPRIRDLTTDVMVSALRRDYEGLADTMYAIGNPRGKIDREAFRAEVALRAEKYLGRPLKEIQFSSLVRDLVQGATQFGLEIPTDFTLVAKAMMTLEGIGRDVDPDLEVFTEVRPFFLELLRKRYSPERLGAELLRRIERLSGATSNMPQQIQEVLEDLRLGRLGIQTTDPGIANAADLLGRRVFTAIVTGSVLLAGALLVSAHEYLLGGVFLLFFLAWLAWHGLLELYRSFSRWRRKDR